MKNATDVGQHLLSGTLDWPSSWKDDRADIPTGTGVLNAVTPFLEQLVTSGLAPTTLQRHFSNIRLLGGEIVRQSTYDSELRFLSGRALVLHFLNEEGGPLSQHNSTKAEQRSFDASCRKLYHFLVTHANPNQ